MISQAGLQTKMNADVFYSPEDGKLLVMYIEFYKQHNNTVLNYLDYGNIDNSENYILETFRFLRSREPVRKFGSFDV